jgi:hypothetical protein
MSSQITSAKEIPNAPFYVMSNDSHFSGWGPAAGRINTLILPCYSVEELEVVLRNVEDRPEQKYVRTLTKKPTIRGAVYYNLFTKETASIWYRADRPFIHHRKK